MEHRLNRKFWFSLVLFGLVGQIAWVVENMYFNVFIYKMFHASPSDISMMVAASAVAATFTAWLMGALSDRVGKRKVFICGGYIFWGISILAFTLIRTDILEKTAGSITAAFTLGIQLTIIMDCVMTFFGSTANDAAFNAWMTDNGDSSDRGRIEGINSMMPLIATLVVFGGFMSFDLDKPDSWTTIYLIIGASVIVSGLIGLFTIKDAGIRSDTTSTFWERIVYCFRRDVIKENAILYAVVGTFAIFGISIQIFMPYLILYYEQTLGLENYVMIMAPAIILASFVTVFYGRIYDHVGFTNAVPFSIGALIIGYLFLFFSRSTPLVFVGSLFMMIGYLTGMAAFGAMIKEHIPPDKAGLFQGLRIFGQVLIPGVVGPFIGALVLKGSKTITNSDGTTSFIPGRIIFMAALIVAVILWVTLYYVFKLLENCHNDLFTQAGEKLYRQIKDNPKTPVWDVYPRPQLVRGSFLSLNGQWECKGHDIPVRFKDSDEYGNHDIPIPFNALWNLPSHNITVPFAPQSIMSGYDGHMHMHYIYRKIFRLPEEFLRGAMPDDKVLLHFGAVDQVADVVLNGVELGHHEGGYLDFTLDCTDALKKNSENELKVIVKDMLSHNYPYGKQSHERGGMWYTPVSGIWKSVWMECVPNERIHGLKITPDLTGITLKVDTDAAAIKVDVYEARIENDRLGDDARYAECVGRPIITVTHEADGQIVEHHTGGQVVTHGSDNAIHAEDGAEDTTACKPGDPVRIDIADPHLWTPDEPYIYRIRITAGRDYVTSYFALRTVTIEKKGENNRVCLNGNPIYLNGVLDQGYYSDGLYTPSSPEVYLDDIRKMKDMGFNLLRKHIKIEPEQFYYDCDRYGMLVMQDMVNNGFYRPFHDTYSPNIWLFDQMRSSDRHGPSTETMKRIFREQMEETVDKLYNHPSIICYTIFNEGWGQFDADEMYEKMKELDATRLADSTSGWFRQKESDFDSRHIYFRIDTSLKADKQPLLISECGGFACLYDDHVFSRYMNFGYGVVETKEKLFNEIDEMYSKMIIPAVSRGLCGSIYTQVSDVEDEINGLLTYDRRVTKGIPEKMRELRAKVDEEMRKSAGE